MQSRSFFTFGASFSFLTESVFVDQYKLDASSIPPVATYLMTEDDNYLITENSNNLIAN